MDRDKASFYYKRMHRDETYCHLYERRYSAGVDLFIVFLSFYGQYASLHISQRTGATPATPPHAEDFLMAL